MQLIGAALGLYVDGGAVRESLLGVGAGGDDVDGLDRFVRRHVRRIELHPGVRVGHAVDADVGGAAAGAVCVIWNDLPGLFVPPPFAVGGATPGINCRMP